ncbi:MAG: rhodanese-like domain-containing protein [Flavobacteriaceae bacterium]
MRFFLSLSFFLLFYTSSIGQNKLNRTLKNLNKETIPYIYVNEAILSEGALFLDTRKKEEFEVSHIKNAIWVGYKAFEKDAIPSKVADKNSKIIVYCSIGVRSEDIGEKLLKLGYSNVKNLYGGIFEWKNQGHAVYTPQGNKTERVHAFNKHWGKLLTKGEKVYDSISSKD